MLDIVARVGVEAGPKSGLSRWMAGRCRRRSRADWPVSGPRGIVGRRIGLWMFGRCRRRWVDWPVGRSASGRRSPVGLVSTNLARGLSYPLIGA